MRNKVIQTWPEKLFWSCVANKYTVNLHLHSQLFWLLFGLRCFGFFVLLCFTLLCFLCFALLSQNVPGKSRFHWGNHMWLSLPGWRFQNEHCLMYFFLYLFKHINPLPSGMLAFCALNKWMKNLWWKCDKVSLSQPTEDSHLPWSVPSNRTFCHSIAVSVRSYCFTLFTLDLIKKINQFLWGWMK